MGERFEDGGGGVVLGDAAVGGVEVHVGDAEALRRRELEGVDELFGVGRDRVAVGREAQHKVHRGLGVVRLEVPDQVFLVADPLGVLQHRLVVLGPRPDRQLDDRGARVPPLGVEARVAPEALARGDLPGEAGEPRLQRLGREAVLVDGLGRGRAAGEVVLVDDARCPPERVDEADAEVDQRAGVVARHGRREAGPDALRAVAQHKGDDGHVVRRLARVAVVLEVVQHGVVLGAEDLARDGGEHGEDVARRRVVLAARDARPELAAGLEQVDVVARADERLRHADDGLLQADLAVVVGRVLRHVAAELRDLDLGAPQLALEARVQDLADALLEAVDDARDGALEVAV